MLSPLTGNLSPLGFKKPSGAMSFDDKLMTTYTAQMWWNFADITGSTVPAYQNPTLDGTQVGFATQNAASPIASETGLVPLLDGTSDYANLFSSAFATAFNKQEFSILIFAKMANVAAWGSPNRFLANITSVAAGDVEAVRIVRAGAAGALRYNLFLNTTDYVNNDVTPATHGNTLNWYMFTATYKEGVRLKSYFNSTEIVNRVVSGLHILTTNPITFVVGAQDNVPAQVHDGWIGGVAIWNRELTATEVSNIYTDSLT
jgi:hypothetical protein